MGDVFCHNSIINSQPVDHSIVTEVPCDLYVINEMDFLTLDKKIINSFQEYIKPYPKDKDIRRIFYESSRWKEYKDSMVANIKVNKAMRGISFGSLMRNSLSMPKVLTKDYLFVHDNA